jgi:rRNA maturation RNase YbeY
MINVSVYKQSNFAVNAIKIKKIIKKTLAEQGIVSDFEVSVAIVNDTKMEELVKKYYKEGPENLYDHPILTFPNSEAKMTFPLGADEPQSLGEMVISYHSAVELANDEGKLVDDVMCDLAAHGALHLVGIHH